MERHTTSYLSVDMRMRNQMPTKLQIPAATANSGASNISATTRERGMMKGNGCRGAGRDGGATGDSAAASACSLELCHAIVEQRRHSDERVRHRLQCEGPKWGTMWSCQGLAPDCWATTVQEKGTADIASTVCPQALKCQNGGKGRQAEQLHLRQWITVKFETELVIPRNPSTGARLRVSVD